MIGIVPEPEQVSAVFGVRTRTFGENTPRVVSMGSDSEPLLNCSSHSVRISSSLVSPQCCSLDFFLNTFIQIFLFSFNSIYSLHLFRLNYCLMSCKHVLKFIQRVRISGSTPKKMWIPLLTPKILCSEIAINDYLI